ncbi:MAG: periplasmic protein TonB [Gammaproteobacteria bacterium]|jgi:TonB family protein|nr:periplasmic protein TonB [Gammaproteobacteria bacterium]
MSQHHTLADWLIRRAARGTPAALAERLEEEWQADLMTRSSSLSRLRFGLGCCWATLWIAREHGLATATAAATATGNIAILREEPSLLSGRSTSLLLVILLHAVVFYALFVSLGSKFIKSIAPPPLVPTFEQPHPRDPVVLPTPQTTMPPTDWKVAKPEVSIPSSPTDDVPLVEPRMDGPTSPPASKGNTAANVVNRVQGGPGSGFPNPDDFYPSTPRILGQQGNVIVQVCVDPNGRLTSNPVTLQSSSNPRLDAAALVLAKAGSGHYRATTEDGHAISSCYPFRVVFTLKK